MPNRKITKFATLPQLTVSIHYLRKRCSSCPARSLPNERLDSQQITQNHKRQTSGQSNLATGRIAAGHPGKIPTSSSSKVDAPFSGESGPLSI